MGIFLTGILLVLGLAQSAVADEKTASQDWPNLTAYQAKNAALASPTKNERRVVFMGDSITEFWDESGTELFSNKSFINRGISGQTTQQMLVRFRADVIDLKPGVVVIMAGTNDLAGNTGLISLEAIEGNIASMTELARVHGIEVVLGAVLPVLSYEWAPEIKPVANILALNHWLKQFSARNKFSYVDYYAAMVDEQRGLKRAYSSDGVHPNEIGYKVMRPLVEQAISDASRKK